MDIELLLAVAKDWSYWDEPPPSTVRRAVELPKELQPNLALVVQGVRRCGKSTLLSQLLERYDLDRKRCLFINFEDPRLSGVLNHETLQALGRRLRTVERRTSDLLLRRDSSSRRMATLAQVATRSSHQ